MDRSVDNEQLTRGFAPGRLAADRNHEDAVLLK